MAFKYVSVVHSSKISFKRTNGHLDPEAGMSKHIQRSDTMAKFFERVHAKDGPPAKKRRISRVNSVTDEQSLRAYGEEVNEVFQTSCLTAEDRLLPQRCLRMSAWKQDWELSEFVTNGQGLHQHPLVQANLEGQLESCLASLGMSLMSTVVRGSLLAGCTSNP